MEGSMRITLQHLKDAQTAGRDLFELSCTVAWFDRFGLSFREFARNGMDHEDLIAVAGDDPELNLILDHLKLRDTP